MDGKQKAAMIGSAFAALSGVIGGAAMMGLSSGGIGAIGAIIGGQITGQLSNFINSLAPIDQINHALSKNKSTTVENKEITDPLSGKPLEQPRQHNGQNADHQQQHHLKRVHKLYLFLHLPYH